VGQLFESSTAIGSGLEVSEDKGLLIYKAVPLQAWTFPECFRRLRLPDFFKTIVI
jgi:hypothetical protein